MTKQIKQAVPFVIVWGRCGRVAFYSLVVAEKSLGMPSHSAQCPPLIGPKINPVRPKLQAAVEAYQRFMMPPEITKANTFLVVEDRALAMYVPSLARSTQTGFEFLIVIE